MLNYKNMHCAVHSIIVCINKANPILHGHTDINNNNYFRVHFPLIILNFQYYKLIENMK